MIVHTHVPSCMETYTQEIGRGGRDGRESDAWACWSEEDEIRARSWVWRDGVEKGRVRLLLRKVLEEGGLRGEVRGRRALVSRQKGRGMFVPLNVKALEEEMAMSQEVTLTLLTHLQLSRDDPPLQLFNTQHDTVEVGFVRPYEELERLSSSSVLLQHLLTSHMSPSGAAKATVSLCDVSNAIGWSVVEVQAELMRLKGMGECALQWKDESIIVTVLHEATEDDDVELQFKDRLVDLITAQQKTFEERRKLHTELMIHSMHAVAQHHADAHHLLQQYFEHTGVDAHTDLLRQIKGLRGMAVDGGGEDGKEGSEWAQVEASVGSFLESEEARVAGVEGLTAKSVSLIMHGLHTLSSAQGVWGKSRWWGKWKKWEFDELERRVQGVMARWREERWSSPAETEDTMAAPEGRKKRTATSGA